MTQRIHSASILTALIVVLGGCAEFEHAEAMDERAITLEASNDSFADPRSYAAHPIDGVPLFTTDGGVTLRDLGSEATPISGAECPDAVEASIPAPISKKIRWCNDGGTVPRYRCGWIVLSPRQQLEAGGWAHYFQPDPYESLCRSPRSEMERACRERLNHHPLSREQADIADRCIHHCMAHWRPVALSYPPRHCEPADETGGATPVPDEGSHAPTPSESDDADESVDDSPIIHRIISLFFG